MPGEEIYFLNKETSETVERWSGGQNGLGKPGVWRGGELEEGRSLSYNGSNILWVPRENCEEIFKKELK